MSGEGKMRGFDINTTEKGCVLFLICRYKPMKPKTRKIQKIGRTDSLFVTLPRAYCRLLGITAGEPVSLVFVDNSIVIQKRN